MIPKNFPLSLQGLEKFAEDVASVVTAGSVIGLSGKLGAGKTEFARHFARALKIESGISSPSYTLENIYEVTSEVVDGVKWLHHWDLYRIQSEEGIFQLGLFDELLDEDRLTLIEWPARSNKLKSLLSLEIQLDFIGKDRTCLKCPDLTSQHQVDIVQTRQVCLNANQWLKSRLEKLGYICEGI